MILRNHGVSESLIARNLESAKAFFALPTEEKMKYHLEGQGGARGYTAFGVETAVGSAHHDLKGSMDDYSLEHELLALWPTRSDGD